MALELQGCNDDPITLVEFILERDVNGDSWFTTENPCGFVCTPESFWFSDCKAQPPHLPAPTEGQFIIESVSHNSTLLEYGDTFSTRGTIKICMHDVEDCNGPGYWLSKFVARQKYWKNQRVNIYTGYCNQDLSCMRKDSYLVDTVDRLASSDCKICFTCKDPLSLLEDATCPNKPVELQSLKLPYKFSSDRSNEENNPYEHMGKLLFNTGFTDAELVSCILQTKFICVGSELMKVEPVETASGWNLKLIDRGQCSTPIGNHESGTAYILPERFDRVHVTTVLRYLLKECIDLEAIFSPCCSDEDIPLIDWSTFEQYKCENPYAYICETFICKPVSLAVLLKELAQVFLFSLFFDSTTNTIKLISIKPPDCTIPEPEVIQECMLARDDYSVIRGRPQYSRVAVFHTLKDCTGDPSTNNLINFKRSINTDSLFEPCDQRELKGYSDLIIRTRFISECNSYIARTAADRWLALSNCETTDIRISLDAGVAECFNMGDYAKLEHDKIRDYEGNYDDSVWFVKGKTLAQNGCVQMTLSRLPFNKTYASCLSVCCGELCCDVTANALPPCESNNCLGLW